MLKRTVGFRTSITISLYVVITSLSILRDVISCKSTTNFKNTILKKRYVYFFYDLRQLPDNNIKYNFFHFNQTIV